MTEFHAICPECNTSVRFERNEDDAYLCPRCGRVLYYKNLQSGGCIVDVERAEQAYAEGKYALMRFEFREAESKFADVCKIDRNNYFADFFRRLSAIKALRAGGRLCGTEIILSLLKDPIEKMSRTLHPEAMKLEFLLYAFDETIVLLNELLDGIGRLYTSIGHDDDRRKEYLLFASGVAELTSLPAEAAMFANAEVAEKAATVCDIGLRALQFVISGRMYRTELRIPSKESETEARALYAAFCSFLKTYAPNHALTFDEEAIRENEKFNRAVLDRVAKYNDSNRALAKRHLCLAGDGLLYLRYYCRTAFTYGYYTLFRGLRAEREANAVGLMKSSLRCAFEVLRPRFYAGADGVETDAMNHAELSEFARCFNDMCAEFAEISAADATVLFDAFFREVYEDVSFHYAEEIGLPKIDFPALRRGKNGQYFHIRNFLYGVVCCAALALPSVVVFYRHRTSDRVRLLKLGHVAGEHLFYLFGGRTAAMENIPKFADFPAMFNQIDTYLRRST